MAKLFPDLSSGRRVVTTGTLPGDTMMLVFKLQKPSYEELYTQKLKIEEVLKRSSRHWGKTSVTSSYCSVIGTMSYVVYYATDSAETLGLLKLSNPDVIMLRMWESYMQFTFFLNWNTEF